MKRKPILPRPITMIIVLYGIIATTACSTVKKTLNKEHSFKDSTAKQTVQTITVSKTDSAAASLHVSANQSGVIIDFDTSNTDSMADNETTNTITDADTTLTITDPASSGKIIDAVVAKIKSGRLRPRALHVYNNTTETKKDSVIKNTVDSTVSASTSSTHVVSGTDKKSKLISKKVPGWMVVGGCCLLLLFLLLLLSKKIRDKVTGIWK